MDPSKHHLLKIIAFGAFVIVGIGSIAGTLFYGNRNYTTNSKASFEPTPTPFFGQPPTPTVRPPLPIIGAARYPDGSTHQIVGSAISQVTISATGAQPNSRYRLYAGKGTAANPCSEDAIGMNVAPLTSDSNGNIPETKGWTALSPGTWQACFFISNEEIADAPEYVGSVTAPVTFQKNPRFNLTGVANPNGTVSLSWASIPNGAIYSVRRVLRNNSTYNPIIQIASGLSNTSYVDSGATPGQKYDYFVVAIVNGIETEVSIATTIIILGPTPTPSPRVPTPTRIPTPTNPPTPTIVGPTRPLTPTPAIFKPTPTIAPVLSKPSDLVAIANPGRINLSWKASTSSSGLKGYYIIKNNIIAATVPPNKTSFEDTSVLKGVLYIYNVQAVDLTGRISSPSNTVKVTSN